MAIDLTLGLLLWVAVMSGPSGVTQQRVDVTPQALELFVWNEAILRWPASPVDPARELAAGVLLQCAAQSDPRASAFPPARRQIVNSQCRGGLQAAQCSREAERRFERVLQVDGGNGEARLRLAWLRQDRGAAEGRRELISMSLDSAATPELRWLAAMLVARQDMAEGRDAEAVSHLTTAREVGGGTQAVNVALEILTGATVQPAVAPPSTDPGLWYSAPCLVLTPNVREALGIRVQQVRAGGGE